MKIYIASRWRLEFREELLEFRRQLQRLGHTVVSRWLDVHRPYGEDEHLSVECLTDTGDVRRCDWLIQVWPEGFGRSRGGNHTEFGMAMAWGKRLTLIGERQHVFHWMPQVEHFTSIDEFLKHEAGDDSPAASCPFCGSKSLKLRLTGVAHGYASWVQCGECDSRGPAVFDLGTEPERKARAMAAWNGKRET